MQRAPCLLLFVLGASVAGAAPSGHPVVPGFERFHADDRKPSLEAGRLLLGELSCTRCHQADEGLFTLAPKGGPVLDGVGKRLQPDWIRRFLADPQATKPGTTMPDVLAGLPPEERTRKVDFLTHYLVSLRGGKLAKLSKYSSPVTGRALFQRVGCAACHADPITTDPAAGHRAAGLVPLEGMAEKYSHAGLTTFLADPLAHRPDGRMPDLLHEPEEAADVAAWLVDSLDIADNRNRVPLQPFKTAPAKVEQGKKLFRSLRCVECHTVKDQERGNRSPPLEELVGKTGGCLDEKPAVGVPRYRLSAPQRNALLHALKDPLPKMTGGDRVHLTVKAFNCYACHMRCGIGGPTPDRQEFFTGNVTLGNEGRFPPHLTDVGRKLKPEALRKILSGKGGIRPYLHTRMPDFGSHVQHLVADFPDADDLAGMPPVDFARGRVDAGSTLMGTEGGVGCITCHGVQDRKGLAMEALSLAGATDRYHPAWFREHLVNPAKLRPGTLMPSFWPDGVAGNKTILGGDTDRQIASIWNYLAAGNEEDLPPGFPDFDAGEFELIPHERPIVQRTMMKEAGSHAIAVGFPEGVHFAFDAERCVPAVAWKGRFIDAYKTWFSRKDPTAEPLGSKVLELPSPLLLSGKANPGKPVFGGYELDPAGVPSFLYRIGEITISDRLEPAEDGLLRTLTMRGTGKILLREPGGGDKIRFEILNHDGAVLFPRPTANTVLKVRYNWSP